MFLAVYGLYKRIFEAREIQHLANFARPGAWIIDVGANVGSFTVPFCRWVSDGGKVLAFEPERRNLESLENAVSRAGLSGRVVIVAGGAADSTRSGRLAINDDHPADHRLIDKSTSDGVAIDLFAIDDLMRDHGHPPCALIKIDVQGAEAAVIEGARETIRRARPALFVEIDDDALRQQGSSAAALLAILRDMGYSPSVFDADGTPKPKDTATLLEFVSRRGAYADVLFLTHDSTAAAPQ